MIVNQEIEVALSKEAYEHLKQKTDGNPIKKTRYEIPLENGLTAELDIFKGKLTGLCFVEVEFQSRRQAEEFCLPDWFGKDISTDRRYRNTYLSTLEYFESGFLD